MYNIAVTLVLNLRSLRIFLYPMQLYSCFKNIIRDVASIKIIFIHTQLTEVYTHYIMTVPCLSVIIRYIANSETCDHDIHGSVHVYGSTSQMQIYYYY